MMPTASSNHLPISSDSCKELNLLSDDAKNSALQIKEKAKKKSSTNSINDKSLDAKEGYNDPGKLNDASSIHNSSEKPIITRQYSRSHQRRFHRRFPTVDPVEKLIDWYACALLDDLLIQGFLYISENHFAFYSNILGFKTELLIPICTVVSVTKEKTAKIFPNAVGIQTEKNKYVFGSLISRDTTFKLLHDVWKSTLIQVVSIPYFNPILDIDKVIETETDSLSILENKFLDKDKETVNQSGLLFSTIKDTGEPLPIPLNERSIEQISFSQVTDSSGSDSETINNELHSKEKKLETEMNKESKYKKRRFIPRFWKSCNYFISTSSSTNLLMLAIVLLVLLFVSAIILLYRVNEAHSRLISIHQMMPSKREAIQREYYIREVERIISIIEEKLNEISNLRKVMENILRSSQSLPACCSSTPKVTMHNGL